VTFVAALSVADVLPVDQVLAVCALGPVGLGLVVSVVFLIATWGLPRVRGRAWARRGAMACGALGVACVTYVWLSARASYERRHRRYLERGSAVERATPIPDAGRLDGR